MCNHRRSQDKGLKQVYLIPFVLSTIHTSPSSLLNPSCLIQGWPIRLSLSNLKVKYLQRPVPSQLCSLIRSSRIPSLWLQRVDWHCCCFSLPVSRMPFRCDIHHLSPGIVFRQGKKTNKRNGPATVLLVGPSDGGKTSLFTKVIQLCGSLCSLSMLMLFCS